MKQHARGQFDASAGRAVQHIFIRPRQAAVQRLPVRLVTQSRLHRSRSGRLARAPDDHRAPLPAHHRHPTRRRRSPHPDDHGRARAPHARTCRSSTASLSDPTVKQQYQDALDRHLGPEVTLAGPAADALREHRLDPDAVHWLQTNFLKTELELGHCLRLPHRRPLRMRPRAHLLEVPDHQRLRAHDYARASPSNNNSSRRHRPRLATGDRTPRHNKEAHRTTPPRTWRRRRRELTATDPTLRGQGCPDNRGRPRPGPHPRRTRRREGQGPAPREAAQAQGNARSAPGQALARWRAHHSRTGRAVLRQPCDGVPRDPTRRSRHARQGHLKPRTRSTSTRRADLSPPWNRRCYQQYDMNCIG